MPIYPSHTAAAELAIVTAPAAIPPGTLGRPAAIRLAMIGPLRPWRGGVAQHTTQLHRALQWRSELKTLALSRPYPRLLFPGASRVEPGEEDYREPGVDYSFDWLSPQSWRAAIRSLETHEPAGVIIPWWTVFFAPWVRSFTGACQQRHWPVIFLCHNVVQHEAAPWKQWLTRKILSRGDAFIAHSRTDQSQLESLLPGADARYHPHPLYGQFPDPKAPLPRRAKLELLFFGLVRPYKGLDLLIDALAKLPGADVALSVVGEWWQKDATLRRRLLALPIAGGIDLVDRYVSDEEAANYFARADVAALPYRSASGTGVVPVAYHYGLPVLATRVGGLADVVEDGVTGRLVKPDDADALAEAIRAFAADDLERYRPGIERKATEMTWTSLADTAIDCALAARARS